MIFSDLQTKIDRGVELYLCDDAAYQSQGSGELKPARVMVDRPIEVERLQGSGFGRARPVLSVAASAFPGLRMGDVFIIGRWIGLAFFPGDETWRLAEAPSRPDDGRWWRSEVEPL